MRFTRALVEPLEGRQLLTAQVVLQVVATGADDVIVIAQDATSITVTENGVAQTFAIGQITRVTIDAENGNDRIDCTTLKIQVSIDGDQGDDTIIGSEKSDRIDGGPGEDSINGGKGHDKVRGEEDDDIVRGGKGNDTVEGNAGEDRLTGDENDDFLDANDDIFEDTVNGGTGIDRAHVDDAGVTDDVEDTIEDLET